MTTVYIIESESSGKWYYGCTDRLQERINEHNYDNGHFTHNRGPWILIFRRDFGVRSEALAFERYLKKTRNKEFIKRSFPAYFLNAR